MFAGSKLGRYTDRKRARNRALESEMQLTSNLDKQPATSPFILESLEAAGDSMNQDNLLPNGDSSAEVYELDKVLENVFAPDASFQARNTQSLNERPCLETNSIQNGSLLKHLFDDDTNIMSEPTTPPFPMSQISESRVSAELQTGGVCDETSNKFPFCSVSDLFESNDTPKRVVNERPGQMDLRRSSRGPEILLNHFWKSTSGSIPQRPGITSVTASVLSKPLMSVSADSSFSEGPLIRRDPTADKSFKQIAPVEPESDFVLLPQIREGCFGQSWGGEFGSFTSPCIETPNFTLRNENRFDGGPSPAYPPFPLVKSVNIGAGNGVNSVCSATSLNDSSLDVLSENTGSPTEAVMGPVVGEVPAAITGSISVHLDAFIDHITSVSRRNDPHGSDFFQGIHKLFFDYLVCAHVNWIRMMQKRRMNFLALFPFHHASVKPKCFSLASLCFDFQEEQSVMRRILGSQKPLPLKEYKEVVKDTGADVDGRLQQLSHTILPAYETICGLFLNFVRDIPGFQDLSPEDQDVLIKRKVLCLKAIPCFYFLGSNKVFLRGRLCSVLSLFR